MFQRGGEYKFKLYPHTKHINIIHELKNKVKNFKDSVLLIVRLDYLALIGLGLQVMSGGDVARLKLAALSLSLSFFSFFPFPSDSFSSTQITCTINSNLNINIIKNINQLYK